jgi:hypothetical protein
MTAQRKLDDLETLATHLGVEVRYEAMRGPVRGHGGLCRVRDQWCVIMDRRLKPPERAAILESALQRFPRAAVDLPPPLEKLVAEWGPAPPQGKSPKTAQQPDF